MVAKVETFEQNIAEEIKRKDASLTEISAASNNVGNRTDEDLAKKPKPVLLIVLVTLFALGIVGMIGLLYFYFTDSLLPPSQGSVPVTVNDIPKATTTLSVLSPTLSLEIGRYVTSVEKQPEGYIVSINSYSPVFSYMARNEDEYITELAKVISPSTASLPSAAKPATATTSAATTTLAQATSTATSTKATQVGTSTKTVGATSTKPQATSTQPLTSTTTEESSDVPRYRDVTIANQNMRVWTYGKQTVVYAFITTEKIAISASTDGILKLKGAIIR